VPDTGWNGRLLPTFTVIEWLPVFIALEPCLIVTESLNYCYDQKELRINAFVIVPTHLHLILFDKDFDNERLRRTCGTCASTPGDNWPISVNDGCWIRSNRSSRILAAGKKCGSFGSKAAIR
jgi:hypothetical protein